MDQNMDKNMDKDMDKNMDETIEYGLNGMKVVDRGSLSIKAHAHK